MWQKQLLCILRNCCILHVQHNKQDFITEGRVFMKKIMAVGMAVILAAGLTACSGGETVREETTAAASAAAENTDTAAPAPAANSNKVKKNPYTEDIKIAYIAHDLSTPNNQAWLEGIERECASWDNIVVQSFNGESSAETQVTIMSDVIDQKYDAIILQCSDGTALAPSVDEAEKAGIPVITLNLDAYTVHSALVMAVDYDAGRMVADEMAKEMNGKGDVVVIQGVAGLTRTDNLEKGFRDTIANYPDIKIIDAQSASFEKETAITVMNSFLQNYEKIDGVFCINDAMAEGAALAVQSAGRKGEMVIWGADGESDALAMIESGDMTGTIYTNSWDEGSTAAKIALLMVGSEYDSAVLTETPQVIMEPIVVTIDTVSSIPPEDRW